MGEAAVVRVAPHAAAIITVHRMQPVVRENSIPLTPSDLKNISGTLYFASDPGCNAEVRSSD